MPDLSDRTYPVPTCTLASTYQIVHAWHDEHHQWAFRLCDQQPCSAIHFSTRPPNPNAP